MLFSFLHPCVTLQQIFELHSFSAGTAQISFTTEHLVWNCTSNSLVVQRKQIKIASFEKEAVASQTIKEAPLRFSPCT